MSRPSIPTEAINRRMAENPGLGAIQARNELLAERHMQQVRRRLGFTNRTDYV